MDYGRRYVVYNVVYFGEQEVQLADITPQQTNQYADHGLDSRNDYTYEQTGARAAPHPAPQILTDIVRAEPIHFVRTLIAYETDLRGDFGRIGNAGNALVHALIFAILAGYFKHHLLAVDERIVPALVAFAFKGSELHLARLAAAHDAAGHYLRRAPFFGDIQVSKHITFGYAGYKLARGLLGGG